LSQGAHFNENPPTYRGYWRYRGNIVWDALTHGRIDGSVQNKKKHSLLSLHREQRRLKIHHGSAV